MARVIHLERLLNKKVRDSTGRKAGRIEEVRARVSEQGCVVEAYLLGRAGLLSRLSIPDVTLLLLNFAGTYGNRTDTTVPWDQMDLTDPRHPKLKCTLEELKAMQTKKE